MKIRYLFILLSIIALNACLFTNDESDQNNELENKTSQKTPLSAEPTNISLQIVANPEYIISGDTIMFTSQNPTCDSGGVYNDHSYTHYQQFTLSNDTLIIFQQITTDLPIVDEQSCYTANLYIGNSETLEGTKWEYQGKAKIPTPFGHPDCANIEATPEETLPSGLTRSFLLESGKLTHYLEGDFCYAEEYASDINGEALDCKTYKVGGIPGNPSSEESMLISIDTVDLINGTRSETHKYDGKSCSLNYSELAPITPSSCQSAWENFLADEQSSGFYYYLYSPDDQAQNMDDFNSCTQENQFPFIVATPVGMLNLNL